ncbi:IPT/TIG domain-containing protein [Hymenobacter sp. YC55]|uniref:PKD domain-containing protein n=1 Tax=Hymenobacter sp. YC55 TaxID=3034019 RepID=UPI0023F61E2C|nr:IPT/TIG domain-containing protein [Hymenobacter sp. YC55]MDF7810494.1 hypothetical protein [Hymenobacter sp. YC55]
MAVLTPTAFVDKWNVRFATNDSFAIDEEDLREYSQDIADSFSLPLAVGDMTGKMRVFTGSVGSPQAVEKDSFYVSNQRFIYRAKSNFNASATPTNNAYWELVLEVPAAVPVLQSTGTSTTATISQQVLTQLFAGVTFTPIAKDQYGIHPALATEQTAFAYLLQRLNQLVPIQVPAKPTDIRVDDVANTLSAKLVPGYPSLVLYEGFGFPGIAGTVPLTSENAYIQDGYLFMQGLSGPIDIDGAGFRVAANGSQPAGPFATNPRPFTGPAVVPGPTLTQAQPASGVVGTQIIFTGTNLSGAVTAFNGTPAAPVSITATQIVVAVPAGATPGNFTATTNAGTASLYFTVTAPAANVLPSANAGSDATIQLPTNSIALLGSGSDSDGTITGYQWRQVTGPNNATGVPANTQNVVASNLIAGAYQFGFKTIDNKSAESQEDFVLVTVNAATPVGNTGPLVMSSNLFTQNAFDDDYSSIAPNYRRRSALATSVPISISGATAVKITHVVTQNDAYTQAGSGYATIDGAQKTYFDNAGQLTREFTLALPDLGTHVLKLYEGSQQRPEEEGSILTGGTFTKVEVVGTNATYSVGAATKTPDGAYLTGDSITVSTGATRIDFGLIPRLRALLGFDVAAGGYGWKGLIPSLGTPELRQQELGRVQAFLSGRTGRRIYVLDMSTNDHGVGYGTPAQAAAAAQAMIELVRGWDSAVEIYLKTPLFKVNSGANGLGFTLQNYTDAIIGVGNNLAYVKLMNATNWWSQADLHTDLLHGNDGGYSISAARYFERISSSVQADGDYSEAVRLNETVMDATTAGTYALMRDTQNYNYQDFTVIGRTTLAQLYGAQQIAAKAVVDVSGVGGTGMFGVYTSLDGVLSAGVFPAAGGVGTTLNSGAGALAANVAFNYALVSSRSEVRLHLNGQVFSGAAVANVGAILDNLTFGGVRKINPSGSGNAMNGTLQRGCFWNIALDAATISSIFAANCVLTPAQYENPNCLLDTSFRTKLGSTVAYNRADPTRNLDFVQGQTVAPSGPAPSGAGTYRANDVNAFETTASDWTRDGQYGGIAYTTLFNAIGTFRFTGSALTLRGNKFPDGGRIKLTLDGNATIIDTNNGETVTDTFLHSFAGLGGGTHTLLVEKADNNVQFIVVSAFVVTG